jgi:hypothetical protein
MNKAIDVIDKFGRKQHRANGILQDGDHMNVPLKMMDSRPVIDPRLEQAMRDADAAKRLEAFDARQHRPGPFVADALPDRDRIDHLAALADANQARDKRIARTNDAWKTPPTLNDVTEIIGPVTTPEEEQARINKQIGAPDARQARTARMNVAWKTPPAVNDAEIKPAASTITPKPGETIDHAAARDRRTERAWLQKTAS